MPAGRLNSRREREKEREFCMYSENTGNQEANHQVRCIETVAYPTAQDIAGNASAPLVPRHLADFAATSMRLYSRDSPEIPCRDQKLSTA